MVFLLAVGLGGVVKVAGGFCGSAIPSYHAAEQHGLPLLRCDIEGLVDAIGGDSGRLSAGGAPMSCAARINCLPLPNPICRSSTLRIRLQKPPLEGLPNGRRPTHDEFSGTVVPSFA